MASQFAGEPYEICIKEPLDPSWSEWLDEFTITQMENRCTRIVGCVKDQTALYGLLDKIRDLNLTLIWVKRVV